MDTMSWRHFSDAIAEASFRAAITRLRYRVRYDSANQWWHISETVTPTTNRQDDPS